MKELLKSLNFLSEFNEEELSLFERNFTVRIYKKDEIISSYNEAAKEAFIVLKGKIFSTLNLPGDIERKHGEYGPGDVFSEGSLFGYKPPFDTFFAFEISEVLIISEKNIRELIESSPIAAIKLTSYLLSMTIRQLRNSSQFLADIVQWGENASRRVITDELTGLYNRAFLDDVLDSFFNISKSNNKPLSLLMLDLDNFREINERYDHETGNKILIELVNLIKNTTSKHGVFARYGGDEYAILLPETDLQKALTIAEQIRKDVEADNLSKYLSAEKFPVTISIGISSFPDTATDLAVFREKADASLYRAKESGKNKVMFIA